MKKRIKVNGIIIFLAFLSIILFPRIFLRHRQAGFLDNLARVFGIILILVGQLLRVCARGFKAENSQNSQALIMGGPYALVRNPMYLGILLIGSGVVFTLFNWWVGIIFLLVFVLRYITLVLTEEKKLMDKFPESYRNYQNRVPRLLPSLGTVVKNEIAEYLPLKPAWLNKEIGSITTLLAAIIAFMAWQDMQNKRMGIYFIELLGFALLVIIFICLGVYLKRQTERRSGDVSGKS